MPITSTICESNGSINSTVGFFAHPHIHNSLKFNF